MIGHGHIELQKLKTIFFWAELTIDTFLDQIIVFTKNIQDAVFALYFVQTKF